MEKKIINLSPWQTQVRRDKHRYKVIDCGRRAGKSFLVSLEMLDFACKHNNSISWMISPSYKQSKLIMWQMLNNLVPIEIIDSKNETELTIRLINGAQIVLKGADNPDSLRGVRIDFCVFDETAFIPKWEMVWNVVRPTLIDSKASCWFISTPNGMNHFKELYDTIHPDWQSFHFTSYDNPYLDAKEIDDAKTKMTPEQFAQEFLGEFMVMAGLFFKEWSREKHVINPFVPLNDQLIVGGMDWGYARPFAFYLSMVEKVFYRDVLGDSQNFYRTKTFFEAYGIEKHPYEWARYIQERLKVYRLNLDDIQWVMGDPSMFNTVQDGSVSIRDQFVQENEKWRILQPAKNDRIAGWAYMKRWMSLAPDGLPYWQITSNCVNFIRTVTSLVYDENHPEDLDTDGEDHAEDSVRYMLRNIRLIEGIGTGQIKPKYQPVPEGDKGKFFGYNEDSSKLMLDISKFK